MESLQQTNNQPIGDTEMSGLTNQIASMQLEEQKEAEHKYEPMPDGTSFEQIMKQYEQAVREAISILICNYSSLNMAIDMGFAGRKQIASDLNEFQAQTGQVTQLKNLVGGHIQQENPANLAVRIVLINMLVALLQSQEVDESDVRECLDDFMEEHFSVLADETSHSEIAGILIKVREQLTYCAHNNYRLLTGSQELNRLRAFNSKNLTNVDQQRNQNKEQREAMGDALSDQSDGEDEDENSDDEMDGGEKKAQPNKMVDDDGFEEVVEKKRRR